MLRRELNRLSLLLFPFLSLIIIIIAFSSTHGTVLFANFEGILKGFQIEVFLAFYETLGKVANVLRDTFNGSLNILTVSQWTE